VSLLEVEMVVRWPVARGCSNAGMLEVVVVEQVIGPEQPGSGHGL